MMFRSRFNFCGDGKPGRINGTTLLRVRLSSVILAFPRLPRSGSRVLADTGRSMNNERLSKAVFPTRNHEILAIVASTLQFAVLWKDSRRRSESPRLESVH